MSDDGFLSRWARRKALVRQGQAPDEPVSPEQPTAPAAPLQPAASATPTRPAGPPGGSGAAAPLDQPTGPAQAPPHASLPDASPTPPPPPPPPTLDDVAQLDRDAPDFSRFVARDVQPDVRNAALKKLFTDPHFNVMDRLDIYIDDYSQPDPLPEGMLARMAQGQFLSLFPPVAPQAPQAPEPLADEADRSGLAEPLEPHNAPGVPQPAALPDTASNTDSGADADGAPPATHLTPAADRAALPCAACPPPLTDENADLRLQPHDAAGRPGPAPGAEPHPGRRD